ncbi:MAG: hypothetical protein ACK5D5_06905 [Bacteroidota bacterium]
MSETLKNNLFFEGYDFLSLTENNELKRVVLSLLPEIIVMESDLLRETMPVVKSIISQTDYHPRLLTFDAVSNLFSVVEIFTGYHIADHHFEVCELRDFTNRVVSLN